MKVCFKVLYLIYFIVLISLVTCKIVSICFDGINGIYYVINDLKWVIEDIKQNREFGYWNYNLKPFEAYSYWFSLGIDKGLILNLLGNIVAFMPMGFFEMALSKHKKLWKVVLKCFIIVTCLELFQFLSCLGYLDIDDITMNTFGCLLGCLSYYLLVSIRRKAKNFFTKI
ncbi:MAG: VanZ family protein [Oscillospiraceae bacterium]